MLRFTMHTGDRPVLKIPRGKWELALEVVAAAVLVASFVLVAVSVPQLPEKIPVHFNLQGEADRWGSKHTLWVLPAIAVFPYALLTVLATFPHRMNYPVRVTAENAAELYGRGRSLLLWTKLFVVGLFAAITWSAVAVPRGWTERFVAWPVLVILGMMFATIGCYFVGMRRVGRGQA